MFKKFKRRQACSFRRKTKSGNNLQGIPGIGHSPVFQTQVAI